MMLDNKKEDSEASEDLKSSLKEEKGTNDLIKKGIYSFLGAALLIIIWEIIHYSTGQGVFPEFFSTLINTFLLIGEQKAMVGLGYSLLRIIITLAISFFIGCLLGLLAAFFPPLEKVLAPLIYFITALPTASLIFIFIIYTKVTAELLVAFLTFPLFYKASLGGGKLIMEKYFLTIALEGRYKAKNFFKVLLPLSLPYMSMGLAQATGLALKAEIMGEVFMSSSHFTGIGVLINQAYLNLEMDRLLALTLLAILVMCLVELALSVVKKALEGRYGVEPVKEYQLI